jgi:ribosomal protein L11 methyltransferase
VPYRVDIPHPGHDALDRLIALGALDAELSRNGALAALMPDGLSPDELASALGVNTLSVSPAIARDSGSVWVLGPRPVLVGRLSILPADADSQPAAIRLVDAGAFGTGLHPTTALCLEALADTLQFAAPETVLDVGTGSGVLALAALTLGVRRACGIDTDDEALRVAAENARLNGLEARLRLQPGGPETLTGTWPLVLANVLAAPLIEMAPALVRRVGRHGRLVLSGIHAGVAHDVENAYVRLGMVRAGSRTRAGWTALELQASW